MKLVQISLRSLALSAFILAGCTSDGTEPVEEVEDENRIHQPADESSEGEQLPSAEQASIEAAEAESGSEAVDSTWTGDVQQLPSEQQLAESSTPQAEEPDQYQLKQAAVEGAEMPAPETSSLPTLENPSEVESGTPSPAVSPELPPVAGAETDDASAAAAETSPAVTPRDPIPTLADVVADSEAGIANDKVKKSKGKKKKSKKSAEASASAPAAADSGDGKIYVVQPGDTLGSISTTLYGSKRRWKEIADKNGLSGKFRIFPGDSIRYTPDASTAAFESKWDGLNKATLSVAKNETLSSIAARVMGNSAYWKVLWQWNQSSIQDPNKIAVGQSLQYIKPEDLSAALSKGNDGKSAH